MHLKHQCSTGWAGSRASYESANFLKFNNCKESFALSEGINRNILQLNIKKITRLNKFLNQYIFVCSLIKGLKISIQRI